MNFKDWMIDGKSDEKDFNTFFSSIRRQVVNAFHEYDGDYVRISFPNDYTALMPGEQPQPQMRLAASVIGHKALSEGFTGPGNDKGSILTRRAIQQMPDGPIATMTPANQRSFANRVTRSLKDVSKDIGLLFELQVYSSLMANHGLTPADGNDASWVKEQVKEQYDQLERKLKAKGHALNWFSILSHHADGMANDIYKKSGSLLKNKPGSVKFVGGNAFSTTGHSADIIVERIGFSLKYSSESIVTVKETTYDRMYEMLGGRDIEDFKQSTGGEDAPVSAIREFYELASKMDKKALGQFISWLMAGHTSSGKTARVYPAYMNYIADKQNVGHSGAISADFDINGPNVVPKADATIVVNQTATIVTIKIHSGSKFGTKVQLEPKATGSVIVKMTNLTQAE